MTDERTRPELIAEYLSSSRLTARFIRLATIGVSVVAVVHGLDFLYRVELLSWLANQVYTLILLIAAIWAVSELFLHPVFVLSPGPSQPEAGVVDAATVGESGEIEPFLRGLVLNDISRIMIMANTGQVTVRTICEEVSNLASSQIFQQLEISVLLRSPSGTDEQRASRTQESIEYLKRIESVSARNNRIAIEHRYYASTLPFRCVLVEHKSGAHSAFISFYDWRRSDNGQALSSRDAAASDGIVVKETLSPHTLMDVSLSWFKHLWGEHKLHTIVFDFDDTLFLTTRAQVSAWLAALRSGLQKGLVKPEDLAPELSSVIDNDEQARSVLTDIFLSQQTEQEIFRSLIPDATVRSRVSGDIRAERLHHRESETTQDALPVSNIRIEELRQLSKEFALVIVSATSERLIKAVLNRWHWDVFPYIFGREAPRQDWHDLEIKSQNLIRVSHLLQVPLDRMVFVGDSEADYRSARQLSMKFVENRFNAEFYSKKSLLRDPKPVLEGVLSKASPDGELTRIIRAIDAAMT